VVGVQRVEHDQQDHTFVRRGVRRGGVRCGGHSLFTRAARGERRQ
jgi:hypothetical protein